MKTTICNLSITFIWAFLTATAIAQPIESAKKVFGPWDGEWQGVFRIFNTEGRLLDSLHVQQKYNWDGEIQRGIITDKLSNGKVEVSHAENFFRNDTLFCVVKKPGGETTVHTGKYTNGRLTWSRNDPKTGMQESFKEYVEHTPTGTIYFIDGVGVYGFGKDRNVLLFEGRYRKISSAR
ncbi:MAG: hypothetical protein ACE5I1_09090 [bacterium]